jgi:hypothetical protein
MRLVISLALIFVLAMAQVSALPRAFAAGDLAQTRTMSGRTTSPQIDRRQINSEFASFWTRGLACQTLRNIFALTPRLDTYAYDPVEGGPLPPPSGIGTDPKYVWPKSKLPISVSKVSCKMMKGSLSQADAGKNKVAFTYSTHSNYIDGKYTLSRFQVGKGARIGYDPVVRTYFDATLHVTLLDPVAKARGPVTVTAASVSISNLSAMSLLAKDAPTIQGLVVHLGVALYNPPGAYWPIVYSAAFPWPNPPSCCFLNGGPFPGWTKWLDSHLGSLLSDAAKGWSS